MTTRPTKEFTNSSYRQVKGRLIGNALGKLANNADVLLKGMYLLATGQENAAIIMLPKAAGVEAERVQRMEGKPAAVAHMEDKPDTVMKKVAKKFEKSALGHMVQEYKNTRENYAIAKPAPAPRRP